MVQGIGFTVDGKDLGIEHVGQGLGSTIKG
jgi:hypothetical protein